MPVSFFTVFSCKFRENFNKAAATVKYRNDINANVEKNMLGKKGLNLNRNGLKQFAKNLIDAIREL